MKYFTSFKFAIGVCAAIGGSTLLMTSHNAYAEGLQIRPLLYNETLKAGETKKGFVDVSNASDTSVAIDFSVEGFRQVNDNGDLQFFASKDVAGGISLDLKQTTLGPKEALRIYFMIDSKKLPPGDVLASIFASTKPLTFGGIGNSARVGTLLVINNGSGTHDATVTKLQVPSLVIGNSIDGTVDIKNAADPQKSSGFFPSLTINIGPVLPIERRIAGPLVTAGISRKVSFSLPTNRIGFYEVKASTDGGKGMSKWIFVVTGWWQVVLLLTIGAVGLLIVLRLKKSSRNRTHPRK